MYAVVQTGGKQYRVTAGSIIEVEKLEGAAGDNVKLAEVLALSGTGNLVLGSPLVENASVEAQIIGQGKGEKVLIFKKKRRHNYRRKNGHRQCVTTLHVTNILYKGNSLVSAQPRKLASVATPAPVAAKKKTVSAEKPVTKKPAAKKPAAKKNA